MPLAPDLIKIINQKLKSNDWRLEKETKSVSETIYTFTIFDSIGVQETILGHSPAELRDNIIKYFKNKEK